MSFAGSTVAALAWIAWDTLIHLDLEVSSFLLFSHNQTAQARDRRYSASGGESTILCEAILCAKFCRGARPWIKIAYVFIRYSPIVEEGYVVCLASTFAGEI